MSFARELPSVAIAGVIAIAGLWIVNKIGGIGSLIGNLGLGDTAKLTGLNILEVDPNKTADIIEEVKELGGLTQREAELTTVKIAGEEIKDTYGGAERFFTTTLGGTPLGASANLVTKLLGKGIIETGVDIIESKAEINFLQSANEQEIRAITSTPAEQYDVNKMVSDPRTPGGAGLGGR